jgi:hypothetical protein
MRKAFFFFLISFFIFVPFARADIATSSNFRIEGGIIDAGGGKSTSTSFNSGGIIGQIGTGISTSTSFRLRGGFLKFPEAIAISGGGGGNTGGATTLPSFGGGSSPRELTAEEKEVILGRCDFNRDKRCDFVDLSILMYYFGKQRPEIDPYDLDRDWQIDIVDISVLMYYWID